MLETAIAFPLLILVALGLLEFALFFHAHNVVEAAAQDSARLLAARNGTVGDARGHFDALVGAGLGGYATHVSADIPQPGPEDAVVTVTAKGDFPTFILWVDPGKGLTRLSLPLDVQVVMNRECFRPHESKPACA